MSEAMDKAFDTHFGRNPENPKDLRTNDQRETSLEQDVRQPRLVMEADAPADNTTRERKEGAAKEVKAMHGESVSASRVDPDPKNNSTTFGVKAEPPALPCRDDVVVENDAAAPKSCILPLEMRTTSAAGGTGKTSTATKPTFNQTGLRLYSTEEESFNDWRGQGHDDSIPRVLIETAPTGDRTA